MFPVHFEQYLTHDYTQLVPTSLFISILKVKITVIYTNNLKVKIYCLLSVHNSSNLRHRILLGGNRYIILITNVSAVAIMPRCVKDYIARLSHQ